MTLQVIRSGVIVQSVALAQHTATMHVGSAARAAADGVASLDGSGDLPLAQVPDTLTGKDADTVDSKHASSFEEVVNKNTVDGYAGLDANILLPPALLPPCLEEYVNHLGAVDNFTETAVTGNGTVNEDAANHGMELNAGITIVGSALFRSKQTWTLGTRPIVASFIYRGFAAGVGTTRAWRLGLRADLVATGASNGAFFRYNGTDWVSQTTLGANSNADTQTISEGDLLTIIATSARVIFLINGVVVADYSTYIPTGALRWGAGVVTGPVPASAAPEFEIDFMSFKRF